MVDSARVLIVEDDDSVRESLADPLRRAGFEVQLFSSAEQYLTADLIESTDCLVLDVAMPGMSGPELHEELRRRRIRVPVVFITARYDVRLRARMMDRGASECLFKPFGEKELLDAITAALRAT